jgi:hypothetical protein
MDFETEDLPEDKVASFESARLWMPVDCGVDNDSWVDRFNSAVCEGFFANLLLDRKEDATVGLLKNDCRSELDLAPSERGSEHLEADEDCVEKGVVRELERL